MSDLSCPLERQSAGTKVIWLPALKTLKSYPVKQGSKVSMVTVPGFPTVVGGVWEFPLCLERANGG